MPGQFRMRFEFFRIFIEFDVDFEDVMMADFEVEVNIFDCCENLILGDRTYPSFSMDLITDS